MTRKRGCPFLKSIVAALKDKIKQFYEEINKLMDIKVCDELEKFYELKIINDFINSEKIRLAYIVS